MVARCWFPPRNVQQKKANGIDDTAWVSVNVACVLRTAYTWYYAVYLSCGYDMYLNGGLNCDRNSGPRGLAPPKYDESNHGRVHTWQKLALWLRPLVAVLSDSTPRGLQQIIDSHMTIWETSDWFAHVPLALRDIDTTYRGQQRNKEELVDTIPRRLSGHNKSCTIYSYKNKSCLQKYRRG